MASDKRPSRKRSAAVVAAPAAEVAPDPRVERLAVLLAGVPEPAEDEVEAAIYAYRAGLDGWQPDFDDLFVSVRCAIREDMRRALHAAAMVRAITSTGAYA